MSFEFEEEELIVNKRLKRLIVVQKEYILERNAGQREVREEDFKKLGYVKQSDFDSLKKQYEYEKKRADIIEKYYNVMKSLIRDSGAPEEPIVMEIDIVHLECTFELNSILKK
jgi:hypothetical protein